jgi:hypothetical protein
LAVEDNLMWALKTGSKRHVAFANVQGKVRENITRTSEGDDIPIGANGMVLSLDAVSSGFTCYYPCLPAHFTRFLTHCGEWVKASGVHLRVENLYPIFYWVRRPTQE